MDNLLVRQTIDDCLSEATDIEGLISSALVAHHLIMFARAASVGQQSASNYSIRLREASVPAE